MHFKIIVTILFATLRQFSTALQCKLAEKCVNGTLIGSSTTQSYKDCLTSCKDLAQSNCGFVTFLENIESSNCELFEDCQKTEACDSCVYGEVQCPNISCDLPGLCLGHVIDFMEDTDATDCGRACFSNPDCYWYSYKSSVQLCFLLETCPSLDSDQLDFSSNQKEYWQPESPCR